MYALQGYIRRERGQLARPVYCERVMKRSVMVHSNLEPTSKVKGIMGGRLDEQWRASMGNSAGAGRGKGRGRLIGSIDRLCLDPCKTGRKNHIGHCSTL